jgi:Choline/ethanolamine kinase
MDTHEPTSPALPLDLAVLTRAVCAALDRGSAAIERWQVRPLSGSSGAATAGIYRVSGTAADRGTRLDWVLILKIIRPAAAAWNPAAREIDHPIYWKREALAYQSGLIADLPGDIIAPRCFAIEERADESCWLWLEQVGDSYGPRWPLAQYAHAARTLGRFNGAYLAGRALPAYPWLGPPGALRGTLQAFAFVRDVVRDEATWQHPLLRAAFPIPVADRLLRLWDNCEPLLAALDQLPQTLCHKDAFRRNMFAAADVNGQQQLVLIDWAYVGRGEIGLDIADLFGASYSTFGVEPTDLPAFDATIFNGYRAGLREAGWRGDPQLARFGFVASAALKYAGLLFWLGDLADEQRHAAWEAGSSQPIEAFVQHQAGLVAYLLDRADEARELLRVI